MIGAANILFNYINLDQSTGNLTDSQRQINLAFNVITIISYFIMIMRFFSYFRIINAFSALVGIITIITQKLVLFLFIIAYFLFAFIFLARFFDIHHTIDQTMYDLYIWLILGGAEGEHLLHFNFSWVVIVIGTIYISIILLNILIAYLSNVFSRLEVEQNINLIREKASMILDFEVILYFFKFVLRCNKMVNFDKYQDKQHQLLLGKKYSEEVRKSYNNKHNRSQFKSTTKRSSNIIYLF